MVMQKQKGRYRIFVSRFRAFAANSLRKYSCLFVWSVCSETALNRSRWGAFRSSCGACVRAWMTSIISVIKGMQQKTECFRARSARAGLGLRGVGMNQVWRSSSNSSSSSSSGLEGVRKSLRQTGRKIEAADVQGHGHVLAVRRDGRLTWMNHRCLRAYVNGCCVCGLLAFT